MLIRKLLPTLLILLITSAALAQDEPADVIDAALADLSAQLGESVTRENVSSYSWAEQDFPDASLGCPQEGQMYAQAITRGYLLLFTFEDTTYDYRASSDEQTIILCGSAPAVDAQAAPAGTPLLSAGPITVESAAQVAELGQIELQGEATAMDWSPAGNAIAVAGDGIRLYSTTTPESTPLQVGGDEPVTSVAFDSTGQIVIAGYQNGAVRALDAAQVAGVVEAQGTGSQAVNSVAVSPDGQVIASASGETVALWSATSGQSLDVIEAGEPVSRVAFSPDGAVLAYGTANSSIHLLDAGSGDEIDLVDGHSDEIHDLAFSPDGSLLASASADGNIGLWNVQTGESILSLFGERGAVHSLAFSKDGSVLASASGSIIDLWDVETGGRLATLSGHDAAVSDLAFSPTGDFLASIGDDGTLRLWGTSFTAGS